MRRWLTSAVCGGRPAARLRDGLQSGGGGRGGGGGCSRAASERADSQRREMRERRAAAAATHSLTDRVASPHSSLTAPQQRRSLLQHILCNQPDPAAAAADFW